MAKHCILVSGPTIANDLELIDGLKKLSDVLLNFDNRQIETIITDTVSDIILLELSKNCGFEVEMIKRIVGRFPNIEIVLIDGNGDCELMARAFAYGARDAFRKPYKTDLLLERVLALLAL